MSGDEAKAIMWLGLAFALVLSSLGIGYLCWRLGRILRGAELGLHRTVDEVVPIMAKTGVSLDRVNDQLGKVDVMMDSAVDMTRSLDTTVRAVSHAVTEPVRAVSSTLAGAAEAARSFRERVADPKADRPARDARAGAEAANDAASEATNDAASEATSADAEEQP